MNTTTYVATNNSIPFDDGLLRQRASSKTSNPKKRMVREDLCFHSSQSGDYERAVCLSTTLNVVGRQCRNIGQTIILLRAILVTRSHEHRKLVSLGSLRQTNEQLLQQLRMRCRTSFVISSVRCDVCRATSLLSDRESEFRIKETCPMHRELLFRNLRRLILQCASFVSYALA